MTLPRLDLIAAQWERVPPVSVSAAANAQFLGVGRKAESASAAKPKTQERSKQDPSALLELFGVSGFAKEKPAWLKTAQTT